MLNVLVNGCNGNMGKELIKHIESTDNLTISCGVDRLDTGDNDFPVYTNINNIKESVDIIIDFSVPLASINILNFALTKQIPIVIATTGFSDEQLLYIKNCSSHIPIFKSSNMSLEINIMNILISKLSKLLKNCDIEIIETHHRNKVDAPSGTALMFADSIKSSLNEPIVYTYDRTHNHDKRNKKEIGIHSIRGGTEVGKHSVLFLGNHERFEITHEVSSRSVFANGAIEATNFLINQKPGLYDMKDLVKLD